MGRLIKILVVLAALWSGWWGVASMSLRASLITWLDTRTAQGWLAQTDGIAISGYPLSLEAQIKAPNLADPATGVAVSASDVWIAARAWWPGYATVRLPEDGISMAGPNAQAVLTAARALAEMRLRPGPALEVEHLSLTSGPWGMVSTGETLISAQDFRLEARQSNDQRTRYDMALTATDLQPGDALRRAWVVPQSWPVQFSSFTAEMDVVFDQPWDRSALETARPQPRQIAIPLAEMAWGEMLFRGSGSVELDSAGLATGSLSLQARNWRAILDVAQASGRLPTAVRQQVENVLSALSGANGNPESLDVDLQIDAGLLRLGFIPLAQVPPLILR